ncbi:ATP-dependent helicase [Candidatus Phytoplasma pruni]|uniref:DNA 3'-5' helicase n=2 Tax=Candidatus Phytoplasma pruni TaxID=479893 RepID=A0A851HCV6_9MOLU|nr:ATP-dependent helicase [Candidatus Phytoplasma pruni]
MDYDDLIIYAYELLTKFNHLNLNQVHNYKQIFIDESQDINYYQYKIIQFLTRQNNTLFMVGDPNQNIYSFRGADNKYVSQLVREFNMETKKLSLNYRSVQPILNLANNLINHNYIPQFKDHFKLKSTFQDQDALITRQNFPSNHYENLYLLNQIQHLIKNGYSYEDIAIFARNKALMESLQFFLSQNNVPFSSKNELDKVRLSTIHSSKGLEYKTVFIIGFENEIFKDNFFNTPDKIPNERRLMYVALTRAKIQLHLLSVDKRLIHGINTPLTPLDFWQEMKPSTLLNNDLKYQLNDEIKQQFKTLLEKEYQAGRDDIEFGKEFKKTFEAYFNYKINSFNLYHQNKKDDFFKKNIDQNLLYLKTKDFKKNAIGKTFSFPVFQNLMAHQNLRNKKTKDKRKILIKVCLNSSYESLKIELTDAYIEEHYDTLKKELTKHLQQITRDQIINFFEDVIFNPFFSLYGKILDTQKTEYIINFFVKSLKIKTLTKAAFFSYFEDIKIKALKKLYKELVYYLGFSATMEKVFLPSKHSLTYQNDLNEKRRNNKRNLKNSRENAKHKAIFNFVNQPLISFLTLTLPLNNADGSISLETKNIDIMHHLFKFFIKDLRKHYKNYLLFKGKTTNDIKKLLSSFKYFSAFQLTEKNSVWHSHTMFDIDLLKIFGKTHFMYSQVNKQGRLLNSEFDKKPGFITHKAYYISQHDIFKKKKSKYIKPFKESLLRPLIIPSVFKIWSDVVHKHLPLLKKLNPLAQNLQVFYKDDFKIKAFLKNKTFKDKIEKQQYQELYYNKALTFKMEIKEAVQSFSLIKSDIATIIADYVSKYEAGIKNKDDLEKMLKMKEDNLLGRHFFVFSRSCKNPIVKKILALAPFDLHIENMHLINFYYTSVLNFDKSNFLNLMQINHILKHNKIKPLKSLSIPSKSLTYYEKHKPRLLKKYFQDQGNNALMYGIFYYSDKKDLTLKHKKTLQSQNRMQKVFNLTKIKQHKPFVNNLDKQMRFLDINNYYNLFPQKINNSLSY